MPYKLQKVGDGYIVVNSDTGKRHSNKPLPRSRAVAQMRALYAAENGTSTKAANYGAKVGEAIAGRLVRAAGGRFGSGDAAATTTDAERTIAQNRTTNAAKPKTGGRKRRAKPRKARARKPKKARVLSRSGQRRKAERQLRNHGKVAQAVGLQEDGAASLLDLAQGKSVTDDGGLEKMGLATLQKDGTYMLTTAGKVLAQAADAGDVRVAKLVMEATTTKAIIPAPMVFKDATGRLRWVTFSSTAYRDRDNEIVSTKALTDDVARADADGQYGPLRWWHQPGIDIGDCDFNAVTGRVLVESGTFRNEAIGERVKAAAGGLQVSIGFTHAASEPDAGGVFSSIRRFERSLLPAGYASNPYTRLVVEETQPMEQAKKDALKAILGDDVLLESLITQAEQTEKAADAAGVAFKETTVVVKDAAAEAAPTETVDDGDIAIGDMTPDEFGGLLKAANQPYVDALTAIAQAIGGQAQTAQQTATKAAATDTRLTAAEQEVATLKAKLEAAEKGLAELQGDLPRSLAERRASQSPATVLKEGSPLTEQSAQPYADEFFTGFIMGQQPPQGA